MKAAFYISVLNACASALTLSDTFDSNVDEVLLAEDESSLAENNSFEQDIVLSQAYDDDLSEESGGSAAPFSLVQASKLERHGRTGTLR